MIAKAIEPQVSISAECARLDELAARLDASDAGRLAAALFGADGFDPSVHFRGNQNQYYDAENSLLNRVLDRRVGIPISLSVLLIEVARRRGLALDGVGMPGHFLVRSDMGYIDAFHGGRVIDELGCLEIYRTLAGPDAMLPPGALDVTPPGAILRRMLANLAAIGPGLQSRSRLAAVYGLLAGFPESTGQDHVRHAYAAAEVARFDEAAAAAERALPTVPANTALKLERQVINWRAQMN